MLKTQHPSNNLVLGAPADWDQATLSCDVLPVTRTDWAGVPALVSYWTPSPQELARLMAGGKVALWIAGDRQPPVALEVAP